jgi:hypothetical protein
VVEVVPEALVNGTVSLCCLACRVPIDNGTTCADCWQICANNDEDTSLQLKRCSVCDGDMQNSLVQGYCNVCYSAVTNPDDSDDFDNEEATNQTIAETSNPNKHDDKDDDDDNDSIVLVRVQSPSSVWNRKFREAEERGDVHCLLSQESANNVTPPF